GGACAHERQLAIRCAGGFGGERGSELGNHDVDGHAPAGRFCGELGKHVFGELDGHGHASSVGTMVPGPNWSSDKPVNWLFGFQLIWPRAAIDEAMECLGCCPGRGRRPLCERVSSISAWCGGRGIVECAASANPSIRLRSVPPRAALTASRPRE